MSKVYVFLNDTPAEAVAQNKREAWMPKGDLPYFDKAANRWFQSRREKRAWLTQHNMREAGELINPNKHIQGRLKTKPSPERERARAWFQSQGGTEGLLKRLQGG